MAFSLAAVQAWPGQAARHPASGGTANRGGSPEPGSAAGGGSAGQSAPAHAPSSAPAAGQTPGASGPVGRLGSYWTGQVRFTFTEPAHTGPAGSPLGPRRLLTVVRYPAAGRPAPGSHRPPGPAHGRFPLIVFAPGFRQCDSTYADLLHAWASAGYVVAAVNFPHSDCLTGAAATESDMVNQPGDMSYVISRLLTDSASRAGLLAGLISPTEVGVAGQSDGGDTVAALAANTCCADHRLAAAAVLSGAEWAPMPGRYFGGPTPPMLFVQGSADAINPPAASLQLYQADPARARFYLDLFGIGHMTPYAGTNAVERRTARVTLAFFDRWVLGQLAAGPQMVADGTAPGRSALVSAGRPPPG